MPIDWALVKIGLDPRKYTIRTGPTFLKKLDPWTDYAAAAAPLRPAAERLLKGK
jgi:bifunctional non-homologous end joining protein LigD